MTVFSFVHVGFRKNILQNYRHTYFLILDGTVYIKVFKILNISPLRHTLNQRIKFTSSLEKTYCTNSVNFSRSHK